MESNSEESEARRVGDEADVEIEECPDEEEADTDLETDRLLGQQRTDDQGFYDDKVRCTPEARDIPSNRVALINRHTDKSFSCICSHIVNVLSRERTITLVTTYPLF